MARQYLIGLIRFVMMAAPFLSMSVMILALWGVIGKTTYIDLETARQGMGQGAGPAKNFMVSDVKNAEKCPEVMPIEAVKPEEENRISTKINWDKVV